MEAAPPDPVLGRMLDRGEAAAIPLAQRLGADLLCDDAAGRAEARRRGIIVIGTLGVLLVAKRRGLLLAVRPVLDSMVREGMFVSGALGQAILAAAGEDDAKS
ncbi:MAG: DUF3368 domain-containing protein [Vicinamibacterales bacterium]